MIEHRLGPARVVWTDRHGGQSTGPFATNDLGAPDGDPADQAANRAALAARLALPDPTGWWGLRQVHGTTVVDAHGAPPPDPPAGDAAVTDEPGRVLVVLTADCAPLTLAADDALAVVHVGWQGLLRGVVEAAAARLRAHGHGPVRAALGPCIHPARYPFGAEDLDRVAARYGDTVRGRSADGRPALDLPAGIRAALARADVPDLHDVDQCTAASPDHFSYRRDGRTGRQAVLAVLDR